MRTIRAFSLPLAAAAFFLVAGCAEKSGVEEKTKISGPEGTTTITKETKVESTGKNPPVSVEPGATTTTKTTTTNP